MSLHSNKIGLFLALASLFALALGGLGCAQGKYIDGRYTGQAEGVHGPVGVDVTVSGGRIKSVTVTTQAESGVANLALKKIPEEIVKAQSPEVEAVSGASSSSKAIMDATAAALSSARKTK